MVNPDGQSANTPWGFTYTAATGAPTATSIAGQGSDVGRDSITVTGTNFVSGATVRIGGTPATSVTFVSSSRLRAHRGQGGRRYSVQVVNPDGLSATTPSGFTYTARPRALAATSLSLTPAGPDLQRRGQRLPADQLRIGRHRELRPSCGGQRHVAQLDQVTPDTPARSAGVYDVSVANPNSQSVTAAGVHHDNSATPRRARRTATFSRYLAEGVETEQMNTQLAIANPQEATRRPR